MSKNISALLLEIIKCPKSRGTIKQKGDALICLQCDARYAVTEGIPVMRANESSLLYDDPEYARNYDAQRTCSKRDELTRKEIMQKITEIAQIKQRTKVLDVGTGTGLSAQFLSCDLVALDYSIAMLKVASEKKIQNLVAGDALNLPFGDDTFDCVFCSGLSTLFYSDKDKNQNY